MSYNNFLNPKLSPLHCENFTYRNNLRCFLPRYKVTCNTNKAERSKTNKLTFSLAAMKFCNSMVRAAPAVPTQTFFRLRIKAILVGKILLLLHQKNALCCMLIFFHVKFKQPCLDQTQKRCVSKISLRRKM